MQQSQRADWNQALELAVQDANRLKQRVPVAFGLVGDYPEANLRHYTFMLGGLQETERALKKRGIQMVVRQSSPFEVATDHLRKSPYHDGFGLGAQVRHSGLRQEGECSLRKRCTAQVISSPKVRRLTCWKR